MSDVIAKNELKILMAMSLILMKTELMMRLLIKSKI